PLQQQARQDHEQRERQQRFDNEDDRAHGSPAVWDRVWVRRGQLAPAQRRGLERPRHGGAQARVLEYAQRRLGPASPGRDRGPPGGANRPVAAAPTSAGRLGMARTTATPGPHQACRAATRRPAATEMSNGPCAPHCPASAVSTEAASCGFTASTTTAAPRTAAALSAPAVMPRSRASASRAPATGSPTLRCSGRVPERSSPPMRARPMLPAPSMARRLLVIRALLYWSDWAKAPVALSPA